MEHRVGTRIKVEARSELRATDGALSEAVVRNASLSGAFVETRARLPLLSRVAVRPVTRSSEWLEGCVVRHDETGLAVEWLEPGVHTVHQLLAAKSAAASRGERAPSRLEASIQDEALARARSEVASGEFDVQG